MKMKRILDVMKIVSLIVNAVETIEYLRNVFRSCQRPKSVKGFKEYEKAESALIVILEMLLAIFKNWKKLRGILKKKELCQ